VGKMAGSSMKYTRPGTCRNGCRSSNIADRKTQHVPYIIWILRIFFIKRLRAAASFFFFWMLGFS